MADIPQEVREAANAFFRDERTGLSVKFNLGHDPDPLLDAMNALFLAGKRAGMERAAEIADKIISSGWATPENIAQAIRSEADGHG